MSGYTVRTQINLLLKRRLAPCAVSLSVLRITSTPFAQTVMDKQTLQTQTKHRRIFRQRHAQACLQAYADSEGPDQTAHSRSLIRVFTVRL